MLLYHKGKIDTGSVIHSYGWHGYNKLSDFYYKRHFRVHHGKNWSVRRSPPPH